MDRLQRRDDEWDLIRKVPRTFKVWDHLSNTEQEQASATPSFGTTLLHKKVHESVLRSYQILAEAKKLLEAEVPGDVVLSVIYMLEKDLPNGKENKS